MRKPAHFQREIDFPLTRYLRIAMILAFGESAERAQIAQPAERDSDFDLSNNRERKSNVKNKREPEEERTEEPRDRTRAEIVSINPLIT